MDQDLKNKSNLDIQFTQDISKKLEKERLLSLIEFTQQTARLKFNPVKDISKHGIFHRFEHDVITLPGVHINPSCDEQDEVWMTVERLVETPPPEPENILLTAWLDISNNAESKPGLKKVVEVREVSEINQATVCGGLLPQQEQLRWSEYEHRDFVEGLFQEYLNNQWKSWAVKEKERRRTIKFYTELFTLKQQLEGAISDTQIELVWGVGIALWKTKEFDIRYPLLIQIIEISLNEKDMRIEIRPRRVTDPRFDLDIYVSIDNLGVADLEKAYSNLISDQTQVFSPFDKISYELQLQLAATHLDPKGVYCPDQIKIEDCRLPLADEELRIINSWVLFARPRSKNIFIQDLENFKKQFNNNENCEISNVVKAIITEPLSEHPVLKLPNFRGLSSFGCSNLEDVAGITESGITELFFPLPFNEEQVKIAQKLECSNGVVVQGPPGTGKTHTIANIISHYMANGKRVLVTSMKEPALLVLKEKLPKSIQPLAISLLTNEQDGVKQFEFAISKIAQELQVIDRSGLECEIRDAELYIDKLHAKLAWIDRSVNAWAKKYSTYLHGWTIDLS